ncbi:tetraacyldisaccharide 4'-kinase [Aureimonas fodinaquatilis]|uniref:Tetraacyldisaccharide 4'-kinase n=1 Tax=Aureimonas fodinaquatilis TaxID=2565783 RepID=A0A5B0E1J5_9HYPH|nr:tetraacyldisaccharide 4'-kinase [Aureimonas fodinaquatilis]
MGGETPDFWWGGAQWPAKALLPAAALYGAVARRRMNNKQRVAVDAPVLCIGNFTVGGGGKTPTALALANAAIDSGLQPGILSRGYGGAAHGPLIVDYHEHSARLTGDEPLLLAQTALTVVAKDRVAGARYMVEEAGCDFIIMDDGFQSARLAVDFALVVIDAGRGLGNGQVIPAGPLRAPLKDQILHADALMVIGTGAAGSRAIRQTARGGKPIYEARLKPRPSDLLHKKVLAFCGIADPEKFYRSLREAGAEIAQTRAFPDHHPLSSDQMRDLLADAQRDGLQLVTTRKDCVRMAGEGPLADELLAASAVLDVELIFEPDDLKQRLIAQTRDAYSRRRFG